VPEDETAESAAESARRLAPSAETLRQLYLLSGNECAFPECHEPIISLNGEYVAQICHIEAAKPGGERFNQAMNNEQRRAAANLMLMCYRHHVETNNVVAYPVERLREIKANHEFRYSEGVQRLIRSVVDWTEGNVLTPPSTLKAFNALFGWHTDDQEEIAGNCAAVVAFAERLRDLSLPARQMLALVVRRGHEIYHGGLDISYGVLLREIEDTTGMASEDILGVLGQLTKRGLAYIESEDWTFDGFTGPFAATPQGDYPTWQQLRRYCDAYQIPVTRLVVDLQFDILDDPPERTASP
jgi:hypothetical protein